MFVVFAIAQVAILTARVFYMKFIYQILLIQY